MAERKPDNKTMGQDAKFRSLKWLLLFVATAFLTSACQKKATPSSTLETEQKQSSSIEPKTQCAMADSSLRSPETINEAIDLINALPKPLSLHCFLYNLDLSFNFVATASSFSAQPAPSRASPRIFLIHNNLIVSVVPDGFAKDSVEFGEVTNGGTKSVKADLKFPVTSTLTYNDAFDPIKDSGGGTSCKICHAGEVNLGNSRYTSNMIAPDPFENVSIDAVKTLAENCSSETDEFRCEMFKIILNNPSLKDEGWPF